MFKHHLCGVGGLGKYKSAAQNHPGVPRNARPCVELWNGGMETRALGKMRRETEINPGGNGSVQRNNNRQHDIRHISLRTVPTVSPPLNNSRTPRCPDVHQETQLQFLGVFLLRPRLLV